MKQKVSVSLDEETLCRIDERMKTSIFRNRSHLIEHAVNRFIDDGEGL